MSEDDNPFDVFGEDGSESSDDEEKQDEETKALAISRQLLVKETNRKLSSSSNLDDGLGTGDKSLLNGISGTNSESEETVDLSHFISLEIPWRKPLYQCSQIKLVSNLSYGGGRGYVASKRLRPGTLVLVEERIMEWPDEQQGKKLDLISVQHLLERPNAQDLVAHFEFFHPEKSVVDAGTGSEVQVVKMIESLRTQCTEERLNFLVELARRQNITSRDSLPISELDILRLLLALRYNGLESGVYLFVAMLNHSCHPNCTKFQPSSGKSYSEVRTTRVVDAGETLTIDYVPRIMSHASRRHHLWTQHRFDIGANLKGDEQILEMIGKSFPPSSIQYFDDQSVTARIEKSIEEMETMHRELANEVSSGNAKSDQAWETIKAMELAALELYTESRQQLKNDRHLLLLPCLDLHLEITHLVQNAPSNSTTIQLGILSRQVSSGLKLLPLQQFLLGKDHFDLAKSNLDLANAIRELLIRSPKLLVDLKKESGFETISDWSSWENLCRKESNRIQALYPKDAEMFAEAQKDDHGKS